jgi:peptidoglycan/xylan/chitin deacetylase (PgdA/CDA1 family)
MRLLIVNFHYVRDVKPGSGIYPISVAEFGAQIEVLGRHYTFISQSELLGCLDAQRFPDKSCCLLTFDDALREQWGALDLLERLSIPALCFATTGAVFERRPHEVHKLHFVFSQVREGQLFDWLLDEHGLADIPMDDAILAEEYRYDTAAMRRIKYYLNFVLQGEERRRVVDALFARVTQDEQSFSDGLYMTQDEVVTLARRGMLGTHTRSHRPLATLSDEDLRAELAGSRTLLEDATDMPIRAVSYPYGGPAAVSQRVARAARDAGLRLGLTMIRGMNEDADLRDGLLLKRVDTNDAPGGKLNSTRYLP